MGMLTHERGWRTNFIAEEGWHLLGGPGGKVIRSKSKLSRGLGVSIVSALHHISDVPAGSEAIAMIKEAQTLHLFRQEHDDDIADCVGISTSNARTPQRWATCRRVITCSRSAPTRRSASSTAAPAGRPPSLRNRAQIRAHPS
jgi:hypothetical protein